MTHTPPPSYSARYTFSGKEKDTETGLSYFGARYYSSDLSVWLSVDPMSDKYPSLSPYTYCANNPVKLVDLWGEEIGDYYDFNGVYIGCDGIDDGKEYLTTRDNCKIEKNGVLSVSDKSRVVEAAPKHERNYVLDCLIRHGLSSPNSELGGLCGIDLGGGDANGQWCTYWGSKGNSGSPCEDGSTLSFNPGSIQYEFLLVKMYYHCHPSGKCGVGVGDWQQEPTQTDISNFIRLSEAFGKDMRATVFGMENRKIYFYDADGIYGTMGFDTFRTFGK